VTNFLLEAGLAQLNEVIQLTLGVIDDVWIEPEVVLVNSLVDSGLLEVEDSGGGLDDAGGGANGQER